MNYHWRNMSVWCILCNCNFEFRSVKMRSVSLDNWISSIANYGKKKQTVTSFAYKSFENTSSALKFLLELFFGIIKHHWKNRCPPLNSLGIIDFLKVLVRWSEIQLTHIRIFKEWINKFRKTALNLVRFWWNLKWK